MNNHSVPLSPVLPLTSFGNVLVFLFSILLATTIIFLNFSVLLSILINKSLRNENRFMFMLSTCLSDICSGVSYYYVGVLDVRDHYTSPNRTFYIAPTFLGLSYMAIIAAQADRYHAVASPFKYSQRMTRNRTLLVILVYWVYAFVIVAVNNLVPVGTAKRVTGIEGALRSEKVFSPTSGDPAAGVPGVHFSHKPQRVRRTLWHAAIPYTDLFMEFPCSKRLYGPFPMMF
ncbi:unnamed protein product [Boreogadus saida]